MKIFALLTTLFIGSNIYISAQGKHDYTWMMGYGFNDPDNYFGGTKIAFNGDSTEYSFFNLPYHFGFDVPCSISDENGNLQFYANGCRIVNSLNETVENGDNLSPGWYQSIECDNYPYGYDGYQQYMILPWPGRSGRYIYFHYGIEPDFYTATTYYSEIDMNANNGLGKVVRKNEILWEFDTIGGSISAVRHGNGRDWWVVIPEHFDNIFRFYLITLDSIEGPFIQNWNNQEAANVISGWNTVFSPDGKKFVRTVYSSPPAMFIYDFDRCSGLLSNPIRIDIPDTIAYAPWAAISPNSRYLYLQIGQTKLYQYDLESTDIEASKQLIGEYDGFTGENGLKTRFHAMALAPDNKIYLSCSNGTHYLHIIHNPDLAGEDCDFRQHDVDLPTNISVFLPNFPNYRLYNKTGSLCDTLGINGTRQLSVAGESMVFPNPSDGEFSLHLPSVLSGEITLYDNAGKMILHRAFDSVQSLVVQPDEPLPQGIYFLRVMVNGEVITHKIAIH